MYNTGSEIIFLGYYNKILFAKSSSASPEKFRDASLSYLFLIISDILSAMSLKFLFYTFTTPL